MSKKWAPLGAPGDLGAAPRLWWRKPLPKSASSKVCFRTKTDALNVFADYNRSTIDNYGGEDAVHRPSEFDAINHIYDLTGKRKVRTIAQALWESLRTKRGPYCLDDINVQLLNRTAPGEKGVGFQIPAAAEEAALVSEEATYYEDQAIDEGRIADCFNVRRFVRRKGRKRAARSDIRRKQRVARQCVCRDDRGRFATCPTYEDVPF